MAYAARSAFLAGAVEGRQASGVVLAGTGMDYVTALQAASLAVFPPKKAAQVPGGGEPSWGPADHVATVAQHVSPSNEVTLLAAMGVFPDARRCVKAFRNFFAHRDQHTLEEARSTLALEYSLSWQGHSSPALLRLSLGGSSVLETWIWSCRCVRATPAVG